ncbi:hypothetical protein [Roseofilum casamattae]|uniref:Uncharacterized protein n=1 Tax=Roseofilum casamattae BLCC-M143 TaxID=3022442 RepID=A0ABT7BU98_9CYAN|nr:hypothetical protein [Roseofilum casamattae]MDJ1182089.1 hypothetical protein [Roseofilum casamattae BLCC-M143]
MTSSSLKINTDLPGSVRQLCQRSQTLPIALMLANILWNGGNLAIARFEAIKSEQ